jgi:hypothetical protein
VDFASPFKSEVFRPIAVLLIPGVIAGLPYALVINHYFPQVAVYRDEHQVVYFVIVTLILIALGFVLEDIGTQFELQIDESLMKIGHADLYDVWFEYLRLQYEKEPIGQRYLRTVLLRMKFELSMAASLVICYVGLVWLALVEKLFSACALGTLAALFTGLVVYLVYQAYQGAEVLANVRRVLVGKPPLVRN